MAVFCCFKVLVIVLILISAQRHYCLSCIYGKIQLQRKQRRQNSCQTYQNDRDKVYKYIFIMNSDDVIFYSSLILCVSLGSYYKTIDDQYMKRNYGTGLGILVACMICGHQIFHTVFMVWGNIIIIKCCDKRYLHQLSLAYTWLYLLYVHFNLQKSIYVTWLHQTIALRLVGLAFEMSTNQKLRVDSKALSAMKITLGEDDILNKEPTPGDIISYAFYFTGLHRGPYYRWKVFEDHFNMPFGTLGDCRIITEQKLKKAFACSLVYLLLRLKYNSEMYYEEAFYKNYGTDFRYLYNIPQLTMYFLQYQIVMLLCTSACTEAGFGVYPAKCVPIPGFGPSTRYSLLKLAARTPNIAMEEEYNFSMLKCFKNDKLILGPKMKDTIRSWDMPTRFWFWANIYKSLIRSNKEVRSACSFMAWSIWVGPSLPQIIISSTLWVYIHLESEYCELYNTSGSMKISWDIGFSIMRVFCLIYLAPCLILTDTATVLKYYNSIYWIFHFFLLFLMFAAVAITKSREVVN